MASRQSHWYLLHSTLFNTASANMDYRSLDPDSRSFHVLIGFTLMAGSFTAVRTVLTSSQVPDLCHARSGNGAR